MAGNADSEFYEILNCAQLAKRWNVPATWIQEQTRSRAIDPIPCVRLGRYVMFEWLSPALMNWWAARRSPECRGAWARRERAKARNEVLRTP